MERHTGRSLARAVQHQGKALSFNNIADLDGALRVAFEFDRPACAIIKHMNPCGCAVAETLPEAFTEALAGDPVSAFGGIVAFNRPVDGETVKALRQARTFFEVVVAPGFTPEALEKLAPRQKIRVLELPAVWSESRPPGTDARRVQGGWLLQDWDLGNETEWKVVSEKQPTDAELRALRFAWAACRNVKSNAIVLARDHATGAALNGVGAGQMSRVDSVKLAISKATHDVAGSVLASDAFFPFPDGVEKAIEAGHAPPGVSLADVQAQWPPVEHPVARTHPHTGRKALFVNPHFVTGFEDMTAQESAPLLDFLVRHATRPENVYRHRWAVGDVLMWDNRCTMHYAVRDYDESMPRLMHRTTAGGETPA